MLFNSRRALVLGMHAQKSTLLWEGLAEMGSCFIPEGNGFQHLQGLCVLLQGQPQDGFDMSSPPSTLCSHPLPGSLPAQRGEGADDMRIPLEIDDGRAQIHHALQPCVGWLQLEPHSPCQTGW